MHNNNYDHVYSGLSLSKCTICRDCLYVFQLPLSIQSFSRLVDLSANEEYVRTYIPVCASNYKYIFQCM